MESKKEAINSFENMLNESELKALQKTSLNRELSEKEFNRFRELALNKIS